MANTVLHRLSVSALNIDALNHTAVNNDINIMNGAVVNLSGLSNASGQGEVFTAVAPTADTLGGLYMACSPVGVVPTVVGDQIYRGLTTDPREFTNIAGVPFDVFRVEVGDIIKVTADAFSAAIGNSAFAVAQDGLTTLLPADAAVAGLSFKVLKNNDYINIANGKSLSQRVAAVVLECVAN